MISFISGTYLTEKACCKFMLKYDTKNYFQQFTQNLSISFQWNATHTDLLMYNYFCLEQLNVCGKYGILSDKYIHFIGKKYVKYIKLFKIQGTGCYDVNVTFTWSPKDDLLQFIKFKFRHVYNFSCIWKKR